MRLFLLYRCFPHSLGHKYIAHWQVLVCLLILCETSKWYSALQPIWIYWAKLKLFFELRRLNESSQSLVQSQHTLIMYPADSSFSKHIQHIELEISLGGRSTYSAGFWDCFYLDGSVLSPSIFRDVETILLAKHCLVYRIPIAKCYFIAPGLHCSNINQVYSIQSVPCEFGIYPKWGQRFSSGLTMTDSLLKSSGLFSTELFCMH